MNRLILHLRVVLGIALVLNLGLCHSLFAEMGAGPGNDPPPVTPPCDTVACYWTTQQEVFSYLFDIAFAEGDPWAYRVLDGNDSYVPITGTGSYSGKIHTDQVFSFDCTTHIPVPLDFSTLPPEQQPTPEQSQKVFDEGWQVAGVAGIVTTAHGQVPIMGLAISATPAELGQYVSYFTVLAVLPADDPFIIGLEPPGGGEPGPSLFVAKGFRLASGPQPKPKQIIDNPPPDPCQGCYDAYDYAVANAAFAAGGAYANAQNAYNNTVGAADTTYNNTVSAAAATATSAVTVALTAQIAALAICAASVAIPLIGFGAGVICAITATATCGTAIVAARLTYDNTKAAAAATRAAAIAAAAATQAAAQTAADNAFNGAVLAAETTRASCLSANNCGGG